jgi:hypothetical protein
MLAVSDTMILFIGFFRVGLQGVGTTDEFAKVGCEFQVAGRIAHNQTKDFRFAIFDKANSAGPFLSPVGDAHTMPCSAAQCCARRNPFGRYPL